MKPTTGPPATEPVEIVLDTTSAVPAVEQIQQHIRDAVHLGRLPTGARLPTIRRLAGHLGVSNGVVARAYRTLEDGGVLRTAGRGGTTVAASPSPAEVDQARRHALARAAADYAATAAALGVTTGEAAAAARAALLAPPTSSSPIATSR